MQAYKALRPVVPVNAMPEKGCRQAKNGEAIPIEEVFAKIQEGI